MKKLFLILSVFVLTLSCKENERLLYSESNMIYFSQINKDQDSIVISLLGKEDGAKYNIGVKLVGQKPEKDQKYRVEVIQEETTAQEGLHYKALENEYIFRDTSGFESNIPIFLYKTDENLQKESRILTLRLLPTSDISVAYENRSKIRIFFSSMIKSPTGTGSKDDLPQFEALYGKYSKVKHEILITIMGHDIYDYDKLPYPSEKYTIYYNESYYGYFSQFVRALYSYIADNEVYDENGDRITLWPIN